MKFEEWGDQLEKLFIAIGLTDKESRVYRVLLDGGDLSAAEIINRTHLKRGITYNILYKLEKDGLVVQTSKGKKTHFRPESPQKLFDLLERKKAQVDYLSANFSQILPKLVSQYKLSVGRPTVRYFEGFEGLHKVFQDIYAEKSEPVYGAIDVDKIEEFSKGHSEGILIPSRLKSKLKVKVIFNDTPLAQKLHKLDGKQHRESLLFDKKEYPLPAEIESYQDKVAFMSFKKGEFIGLIIQNEDFAITLGSILRFIFDHLRECKSSTAKKA